MYYQCSESKGADQLLSYIAADLRFCYTLQKAGFLMMRLKMSCCITRLAPSADVFTISMCSTLLTFRMFTEVI